MILAVAGLWMTLTGTTPRNYLSCDWPMSYLRCGILKNYLSSDRSKDGLICHRIENGPRSL